MTTLALIGLAAAAFATTNVDDLLLLLGFMADARFGFREVLAGQMLGIGILTALSLLAASMAAAVPAAWVGLMGLAPIGIGIRMLWLQRHGPEESDPRAAVASGGAHRRPAATVALVTLANGGDNIAAYTPIFATETGPERTAMIAVFAALTLVWCLMARWLVGHPAYGAPLRRYGRRALPALLIGLGLLILARSGSIGLLGP